ncbi:MAG TPA: carboxypeptidase regulatory-like domain-containing protein [Pyrinomonadaceae bacterium]|jgi:hypothetical protein
MSKKLLLPVFVFSFLLLLGFEKAAACSCAGGANPCGFFRAAGGVAFIGTVTNVIDAGEKYGQPVKGKVRKITIRVDEVFKGFVPPEVITSDDGYRCDNFPFMLGKTYLIYSKGVLENTENILPVGLCSGTTTVENAQESIDFLRQLKAGNFPSILYGKLQKTVNDEKNPYAPLAKTKIVLTKLYAIENGEFKEPKKKERKIETLTDENGEYKFENLAAGQYKLSAELPGNLWMPEIREFGAGGKPFCENRSLYAFTDGRISGSVVSFEGAPVGFVKLRITSDDKNTRFYYGETQTDKDGNYTFYGLSEGKYKIHVYLQWYRLDQSRSSPFEAGYPYWNWHFGNVFDEKEAQIINLGNTEKIQNANLKMPAFPVKQTIRGSVVWEDGTPAKRAIISYRIKKFGDNHVRYADTKEDGSFSLQIYEEFEYEFMAANNSNEIRGFSNWVIFDKEELKNPVKLIMKPQK